MSIYATKRCTPSRFIEIARELRWCCGVVVVFNMATAFCNAHGHWAGNAWMAAGWAAAYGLSYIRYRPQDMKPTEY